MNNQVQANNIILSMSRANQWQNWNYNLGLVLSLVFFQLLNIFLDNFVEDDPKFLWTANATLGEFLYLRLSYIFQNSF